MPADSIHIEIEGMDENGLFIRIARERYGNQWYVHGSIHRQNDDNLDGGISNNFMSYDDIDPQSYFKAYHHLITAMAHDSKWIKERYNVGPKDGFPTKLHISSLRNGSLPAFKYSCNTDGIASLDSESPINSKGDEITNNGKSNNTNGGNEG